MVNYFNFRPTPESADLSLNKCFLHFGLLHHFKEQNPKSFYLLFLRLRLGLQR